MLLILTDEDIKKAFDFYKSFDLKAINNWRWKNLQLQTAKYIKAPAVTTDEKSEIYDIYLIRNFDEIFAIYIPIFEAVVTFKTYKRMYPTDITALEQFSNKFMCTQIYEYDFIK